MLCPINQSAFTVENRQEAGIGLRSILQLWIKETMRILQILTRKLSSSQIRSTAPSSTFSSRQFHSLSNPYLNFFPLSLTVCMYDFIAIVYEKFILYLIQSVIRHCVRHWRRLASWQHSYRRLSSSSQTPLWWFWYDIVSVITFDLPFVLVLSL